MCTEVHEKQIRRVMKQMIMKGRYLYPMFCQCTELTSSPIMTKSPVAATFPSPAA